MKIRELKEMIRAWWDEEEPENQAEGTAEESADSLPDNWKKAPEVDPLRPPAKEEEHVIKLPADHPLNRLHALRTSEKKGKIPAPRICLDEEGVLPEGLAKKEMARLRQALTAASLSRLNKAKPRKDNPPPDLDAELWFYLSADKLAAWMLVFPPAGVGQQINRDMIYRGLKAKGISYGVNETLADRLSRNEHRYCTLYVIAVGKPAFDGKNGNIVDAFPRGAQHFLEVDEYDQADYTNLNWIQNVAEGDEICRLILPTEGEPGVNVLNQPIPAKSGKAAILPKGRNTEISEDGTRLVASMPGHVEFTNRAFHVKPVLEIGENVDFSTGDIKFLGDVHVHGDVCSGFIVRAQGNVQVDGVIEAGSTVEAGGDLMVTKGILGDGETIIRGRRGVFAKYMEGVIAYVRENLQTDCLVNCEVYCDGDVQVESGRGTIIGGQVWAAQKVSARVVGAKSKCRTTVTLGGQPCATAERKHLLEEIEELEKELEKAENQLDSPTRSAKLSRSKVRLPAAKLKLDQLEKELEEYEDDNEENDRRRLECGIAYPGTEIIIDEERMILRQEKRQCIAKLLLGEIILM